MTRKGRLWRVIALDLLLFGAGLVAFALFHHALPSRMEGLGILSNLSASTAKAEASASSEDTTYNAQGISITMREGSAQDGAVSYLLADISLKNPLDLQTAFAQDTYGRGLVDSVENMSIQHEAVLSTNGDYYGSSDAGVVVRNGIIYRASYTTSNILCLYANGSVQVKAYEAFDVTREAQAGIWQAWTFGPSLLDEDGQAITSFAEGRHLNGRNPRTVFGYYEPGHYALLVVDGRGDSEGLSLTGLSELCQQLGFTIAYNLDGGKSSVMTFAGAIVNQPASGGRALSDIIFIGAGEPL